MNNWWWMASQQWAALLPSLFLCALSIIIIIIIMAHDVVIFPYTHTSTRLRVCTWYWLTDLSANMTCRTSSHSLHSCVLRTYMYFLQPFLTVDVRVHANWTTKTRKMLSNVAVYYQCQQVKNYRVHLNITKNSAMKIEIFCKQYCKTGV